MKKSLAILYIILLLVVLSPIMVTEAQTTVSLKNNFGEDSYMEGYDFSARVVQTVPAGDENNPLLSSDFYLGDSCFPVSTPAYHSPIPVINYGAVQLSAITQIPAKNDSRFATQAFVQDNTYGLFTREGDFVAIRIQRISRSGDGYEMNFSWQYVKQGQPSGVLSLTLTAPDKQEFALGDNVRVEGKLALDGQPVLKETDRGYSPFITLSVKDQSGKELFGVSTPSDKSGYYQFVFEYGSAIPTGFKGTLVVKASATHNSLQAEKTINVKYGSEPAKKALALQLFGPKDPIEIGGFDSIGIGGKITSQGADVDGALVTMKVAGQTFQTTTGTHTSGSFNWYWNNDTFPAGSYTVEVTVTKDGYQTATGKVPFTLLGKGYDYRVVMDPISPQLAPATNVSFPGKYYFAGKPHSGWIEIDVTFPNGRTNTYTELTPADGRFSFKLPSMMETGFYTLKVYRHETRALISDTYTWKVGEDDSEDDSDIVIPPKPVSLYQIVDVQYPAEFIVGQPATISGRVIGKQGDVEIPMEGWLVIIASSPLKWVGDYSWGKFDKFHRVIPGPETHTKTDSNGSFRFQVTPINNMSDAISICAIRDFIEYKPTSPVHTSWYGPLSIVNPLDPILTLEQTDYDRGTLVSGTLQLRPAGFFQYWKDNIKVAYHVTGPLDGTEKNYIFAGSAIGKNDSEAYDDKDSFSWLIPGDAGAGMYEITAYVTGPFLAPTELSAGFFVNDIVATTVTAYQHASADGWGSDELTGLYSDFKGDPIPGDKLRVHFYTGSGTDDYREYEMEGTIEQDGTYTLNLEPFDFFGAWDWALPLAKSGGVFLGATVYAEKEGYATAVAIIPIKLPDPKIEIISVNPDTAHFNRIARGGINYDTLVDMDIKVKVRYNNLFDGAKLTVGSKGHWGTYERDNDGKLFFHLNVESAELPFVNKYHDWTWVRTWSEGAWGYRRNYLFPEISTSIPAKTGLKQESEFTVKGKIDLRFYKGLQNSPYYDPAVLPVIQIFAHAPLGATAVENYYFTPPNLTPATIEVELAENPVTRLNFQGVVADGSSRLGMKIRISGHQREGSLKVTEPTLGTLAGNALSANGEITLDNGEASLTYVPPEYLNFQDLTEYNEIAGRWNANVPIIFTYTAKDGSVHEKTVNIKVYNPPVLLVHGYTGDYTTWEALAEYLRERKYYIKQGFYYASDHSIQAQAVAAETY